MNEKLDKFGFFWYNLRTMEKTMGDNVAEYNHKNIEAKWQEKWEMDGIYKVADSVPGKQNHFTLVEFSYPSGNLHVGHWYAFSVPDIFARYKRMQGFNSLYPMGFDAFGLPAENAAIKLGEDPKTWTYSHMDKMRVQLRSMGTMFDWSREVVSCSPEYYKWTQFMFAKFFENDLAYRSNTKVNWCPKDMTILANEQVVDGKCDRCGTVVEQKNQDQWMLRITKYADSLIDDLNDLNWPDSIKESQRNWIGRSEGSEIDFKIKDSEKSIKIFTTRADTLFGVTYVVLAPEHPLVQDFVLTFESGVTNKSEIEAYVLETKNKSELDRQQAKEKTGVEVKGIVAINPANGEEVPVWVADYVLAGYGTGAVMAVPAHDERDFEFANKYNLSIKQVVEPIFIKKGGSDGLKPELELVERNAVVCVVEHWSENKFLCLAWKKNDWKGFVVGGLEDGEDMISAGEREIKEETGYQNLEYIKKLDYKIHSQFYHEVKKQNRFAHFDVLYFKLKNDEQKELAEEEKQLHDLVWVPESKVDSYVSTDEDMQFIWRAFFDSKPLTEEGVLVKSNGFNGTFSYDAKQKITEFVGGKVVKKYRLRDWGISRQRYWGVPIPIVYDPQGVAHAIPIQHLPWLLPTDVDHTPDGTAPLARSKELFERTEKIFGAGWTPEVETMDTFVDSSWYFYRYLDPKNENEFCSKEKMEQWLPINLYMGGAEHTTMHVLYSRFWTKALHDIGLVNNTEEFTIRKNRGLILGPDGDKMSKSKGNVIDPDEIVERLGADTVRMYLAFMGPYGVTVNYPWDPNGVVGVRRFLERVWRFVVNTTGKNEPFLGSSGRPILGSTRPSSSGLFSPVVLHKAIKKITEDIEEHKYNTAISQMMICLNEFEKSDNVSVDDIKIFLQLLAPFAPHMTEELWYMLGEVESVHTSSWPKYDESKIIDSEFTIAIQVNGKVRDEIVVGADAGEEEVKQMALASEKVQKWITANGGNGEVKKVIYIKNKLVSIVL